MKPKPIPWIINGPGPGKPIPFKWPEVPFKWPELRSQYY